MNAFHAIGMRRAGATPSILRADAAIRRGVETLADQLVRDRNSGESACMTKKVS